MTSVLLRLNFRNFILFTQYQEIVLVRKDLLLLPLSVECAAILPYRVYIRIQSAVFYGTTMCQTWVASITSHVVFAGADGASAVMTSLISTGAVLLHLQVNVLFSVALLFE